MPLDEALAEIGGKLGVRLECAPSLAERKITVLVDGPSTARTLVRFADVLRGEWEARPKGYRLFQSPRKAAEETAYVKSWSDVDAAQLEADLKALAPYGERSREELAQASEKASLAARRAIRNGEPVSAEYLRLNGISHDLYRASQNYDLAVVAGGLDADGWRRLMGGGLITAGKGARYRTAEDATAPDRLYLRRNPMTGRLQMRTQYTIPGGQSAGIDNGLLPSNPSTLSEPARRFQEETSGWGQRTPAQPDLPLSGKVAMAPPWSWSGRPTHPDRLEWLHRASGLPVVALGDRRFEAFEPKVRPTSLGGFWESYGPEGDLREEDGFVMFRPYRFWEMREPSERWFRRLEATPQPSLETYVALVAELPPNVPAPSLSGVQTSVCPTPFGARPALVFLGSLPVALRDRLLKGGSARARELPASSRLLFEEAVVNGLFGGGAWARGGLLDALARPETLAAGEDYGVFASDAGEISGEGVMSDPYAVRGRMGQLTPGVRLSFGFGPEDGMVYEIYRRGLPPSARTTRNAPW